MPSGALVMEDSREWATACDVQRGFMNHLDPAIDTLSYSARCRQVGELGGDCYDFIPLSGNRLAVAVGDASGKGLAAALMIASVQSSVRTAASLSGNDLARVIGVVNRQVHATSLANRYATLFYGVFDGTVRTLRYVNAGHNPPIVFRRNGAIICLETGGLPVGISPNCAYKEGVVQLNPGDLVLAYSDGVIEATNPAGEEWGVEGLRRAVTEGGAYCVNDIIHAIFTSMDEFSRGRQTDDATVVVLRVH
jgi:phosphoserine phosphatase RsbU/P